MKDVLKVITKFKRCPLKIYCLGGCGKGCAMIDTEKLLHAMPFVSCSLAA